MTERGIVAVFSDTNSAYDAAKAIRGAKVAGATDFDLKSGVMIRKDDRGNVQLLEEKERPLWGTLAGGVAGALVGLLAGPAGAVAGGAIGAAGGLTADAIGDVFDADFVDELSTQIRPGECAVVVEANEGSTRFVDDIVKLHGGRVYRSSL